MRVLAGKKGFSLVELLTVIAIIAVLAGIIFPVMGMVKSRANMTKCITQLHEIGLGLQVFKQDNRKYPDILGAVVVRNPGIIPFDQTGANPNSPVTGLYPEYVKAARLYHCPSSKNLDMTKFESYDPIGSGTPIDVYSYDSYDFMVFGTSDFRQHYSKSWANTPGDVGAGTMAGAPTDPVRDYERQLKFRTPPDDTVVTWCSWHEITTGSGASLQVSGKTPTLYLDGHVDSQNAADVEKFLWRVMPKKE